MKAWVNKEKCKGCGLCVINCPKKVLQMTEELNSSGYKYVAADQNGCIGCGICYTVCPDGVFTISDKGE